MPLFEYAGFDAAGKKTTGTVDAPGRRAAMQKLQGQKVFATELSEVRAAREKGPAERWRPGRGRVPVTELAVTTRQLATLIGAGLPLDEALSTVARQLEHPRLARAINQTREEVVQGTSLHRALEQHPQIFPALLVNMVQVGESSGTLDQVLHRLADFLEDQARLAGRLRAALAYPVLMAVVGVGVLFFLMAFVVPKVTRMLEDLGQALPLPTRVLLGVSGFFTTYWWLLLIVLALAVFAFSRYARSEKGRETLDRKALTLPLFGKLNLLIATARLSRTLATLLRSGVPLLKALEIVENLMTNRVLKQTLEDTAVAVREGEGLAGPLRRARIFPPMVTQMAEVGERSGALEEMLFKVAEAYERQVDSSITGMLSLLEPLMILLMGSVVGFIVMAILLPIFQASQGMG